MKNLKIYEYEKCSTCKNALKLLEKQKVHYKKISIVENPPSEVELKKMLGFLKGDIKKLFNTSGMLYREMEMSKKLPCMSLDEAIRILTKNGKLVKRPFAISDDWGTVGFSESEWKKALE